MDMVEQFRYDSERAKMRARFGGMFKWTITFVNEDTFTFSPVTSKITDGANDDFWHVAFSLVVDNGHSEKRYPCVYLYPKKKYATIEDENGDYLGHFVMSAIQVSEFTD